MTIKEPLRTPTLNAVPVVCRDCGNNAPFVSSTPDSNDHPFEYQTFECTRCQTRVVKRVSIDQESDEEIEKLAERMSGVARTPPE